MTQTPTNRVEITVYHTNNVTLFQTNIVTDFQIVTNYTTNTVFEPSPTIVRTIETAQAVAGVTPFSPIASPILGLAGVLLTWYAKRKTDQVNALVDGVEKGNSPETKRAIATVSAQRGVAAAIDSVVWKRTK